MSFFVTRQSPWYDERYYVEIAYPVIDHAGPGALGAKYPDEFEGFEDPREAAEAAIEILKRWRADLKNGRRRIAGICLSGNDLVYPSPDDRLTIYETRAWARRRYEQLPKCDWCGGLGAQTWWHDELGDDISACSERCVEEMALDAHKQLDPEDCQYRGDCFIHDNDDDSEVTHR